MTTKNTADQRIRQATATVVLAVAGFAATVSYLYIRDVAMVNTTHGVTFVRSWTDQQGRL